MLGDLIGSDLHTDLRFELRMAVRLVSCWMTLLLGLEKSPHLC
jgi:hypothetical protein